MWAMWYYEALLWGCAITGMGERYDTTVGETVFRTDDTRFHIESAITVRSLPPSFVAPSNERPSGME